MLTTAQLRDARAEAAARLAAIGVVLTESERMAIEIADFGLSDLGTYGLAIVVYINTDRVCAKELVMTPGQICPEHLHPPYEGSPGKEETFRCRAGLVRLYVEGAATENPSHTLPDGDHDHFSVFHEVVLRPGDQYTIMPGTRHWFQAGSRGAVVSEFSTRSTDELDVFTDPRTTRETEVMPTG
jgi:D-lyxose ketol-isomerase